MIEPSYCQCYICNWEYITYFLDLKSGEMEQVDGRKYCPLCSPTNMELEDKLINSSRIDLARTLKVLDENPTAEQIEQEIFKERQAIVNMSEEELGAHIDELDKLYKALHLEVKKTKTKIIAGLEIKREKYGNGKKPSLKKKLEKGNVDDLLAELDSNIDILLKKDK